MKIYNYLLILFALVISCKPTTNNIEETQIVKGQLGEKIDNYLTGLEPFGLSDSFLVATGIPLFFTKHTV